MPLRKPTDAERAMSLELRRRRRELKNMLSEGIIPLAAALEYERAQGMKVLQLVRALPGIGDAKAAKLLEACGIRSTNSVAQCGPKQKAALLERVKKHHAAQAARNRARAAGER